jgi:hypothetical protein
MSGFIISHAVALCAADMHRDACNHQQINSYNTTWHAHNARQTNTNRQPQQAMHYSQTATHAGALFRTAEKMSSPAPIL